ncbi:MAG: CPBP family intramembrane metalloprotease, partial [Acidobacteria bacterium]
VSLPPPRGPLRGDDSGGGAPPAPWGIGGTILGILTVFFLMVVTGGLLALAVETDRVEAAPLAVRYAMIAVFQLILIAVPIGAAVLTGGGPAALGLRRYEWRGLAEGALLGAALVAVSAVYSAGMERLAPELYRAMAEEQRQQLELLDGPLPLLLFFVLVMAPFGEEIFFRGFVFTGLRSRLGFPLASGLSAALFAAAHVMPLSIPVLFAVGLGTAAMMERHGSLAVCLVTHAAFNLASLLLENLL